MLEMLAEKLPLMAGIMFGILFCRVVLRQR